jgi:Holliday junction resolvase RusA-like endonuclease
MPNAVSFSQWTQSDIDAHNARVAAGKRPTLAEVKDSPPPTMKPVPRQYATPAYIEPARQSNSLDLSRYERQVITLSIFCIPMGAVRCNRSVAWAATPTQKRYYEWKKNLLAEATKQLGRVPAAPDELNFVAYIPMPDSWSKTKKAAMSGMPHRQKPDRDNIDKAICDALFPDDKRIWGGQQRKVWCKYGEGRIDLELIYYYAK